MKYGRHIFYSYMAAMLLFVACSDPVAPEDPEPMSPPTPEVVLEIFDEAGAAIGDVFPLNKRFDVHAKAKHGDVSGLVISVDNDPIFFALSIEEVAKMEVNGLQALKPVVVEFRGFAVRDSAGVTVLRTVSFEGTPVGEPDKSIVLY